MLIEIEQAKNNLLDQNIESLAMKIEIADSNKRDILLAGFFRNAFTHYRAMDVLIEKKLYNSTFALVRVFFETIVRARYMYHILDQKAIDELYEEKDWDKVFNRKKPTPVNLGTMCEALDTRYSSSLFVDIKTKTYKIMNDYTHTGANQIAHNFNEDTGNIEPNFSIELIANTLTGNYTLMKSFAILYFEIGLKQGEITAQEMNDFDKALNL